MAKGTYTGLRIGERNEEFNNSSDAMCIVGRGRCSHLEPLGFVISTPLDELINSDLPGLFQHRLPIALAVLPGEGKPGLNNSGWTVDFMKNYS